MTSIVKNLKRVGLKNTNTQRMGKYNGAKISKFWRVEIDKYSGREAITEKKFMVKLAQNLKQVDLEDTLDG